MKCLLYSSFIAAKFAISVRKTVTLTTLERLDPAAASTAAAFWMASAVFSWIVPDSKIVPEASQGMQPEAKIRPLALMAWDWNIVFIREGRERRGC